MPDDEIGVRLRLLDKQRFVRDTKDGGSAVRGIGKSAEDAEKRSRRAFGLMGRGLLGVARAAKYGAAVGIAGMVVEAKRAVDAFEETRKVGAQVDAVVKSTGGEANVTAKHVNDLSTAMSRKTGMDDEALASSQALLLTFRDVRNEAGKGNKVFDQTARLTADMAAAMHTDLNAAALQLGKALNDPLKGMTRLQRVGVTFNKTQQQQIEDFVKLGDVQSAQRVILKEVRKEFGGSAAAQATALDRLKVSWGNVEEAIGGALSPLTDAAASGLDRFFDQKLAPALDRFSNRSQGIFKRSDLDLGEKLVEVAREARRDLGPFGTEIRNLLRDADLGDKFKDAVEWAAPKIADGFATAAPRAAEAFVNGFRNAGPWGKLVTVAFLASKFGAFRGAGTSAAGLFVGGFRNGGKTGGRFEKLGGAWGKLMGVAMVASLGLALRDWLKTMPKFEQYSGAKGWGELSRDLADWLPGEDSEARRARIERETRANAGRISYDSRGRPTHVGHGSVVVPAPRNRGIPSNPVATGRGQRAPQRLEIHVHNSMDGNVFSESIGRVELRQRDLDGDD